MKEKEKNKPECIGSEKEFDATNNICNGCSYKDECSKIVKRG